MSVRAIKRSIIKKFLKENGVNHINKRMQKAWAEYKDKIPEVSQAILQIIKKKFKKNKRKTARKGVK